MPFHVPAEPESLLDDLRKLFQTFPSDLADTKLAEVNQSLLAASCAADEDDALHRVAEHLRNAPPQVASALTALMHGAPVEMDDACSFFDVLKVGARMHFHACEDICQQKVTSKDYRTFPIQLQLSVEHGQAIRQHLKEWQAATVPHLTDATILIETDDPEKPKSIRVHSIILASSCAHLRDLWTGDPTGSHVSSGPEVVLDREDSTAAALLIQAVYGDAVQAETMDDLLRLCCLADRWQCATVLNAALATVEDSLEKAATGQPAVDILGWAVPAPNSLLQTVFRCVTRWFDKGKDHFPEVKSMPFRAAVQLLDLLEQQDVDSDTSASSKELYNKVHSRLLECLCDASEETPGLVQLKRDTMMNIMQSRARLTVHGGTELGERISLWASMDSKTGNGEALVRTVQLLSENMPDVLQAALRQALCSFICSPGIACTVANAILAAPTCSPIFSQMSPDPDLVLEASIDKCAASAQDGWMIALPVLEPVAKDLLADVALEWLVGHVDLLVSCAAWQKLQPSPFTQAAKAMIQNIGSFHLAEAGKSQVVKGDYGGEKRGRSKLKTEMEEDEGTDKGDEESYEEAQDAEKNNMVEEGKALMNLDCESELTLVIPVASDTDTTGDTTVEEDEKEGDQVKETPEKFKRAPHTYEIHTARTSPGTDESFETNSGAQDFLVRKVVAQWVGAASVTSASEAIRLASTGSGTLFDMLMEDVTERWSAAEHQNAALEGGRHEGDKTAAVAAARKQADAQVRAECDETVGMLRSQLAEAHSRQEQTVARQQKSIDDIRVRVMAAFPAETVIARRGCLCNMFF